MSAIPNLKSNQYNIELLKEAKRLIVLFVNDTRLVADKEIKSILKEHLEKEVCRYDEVIFSDDFTERIKEVITKLKDITKHDIEINPLTLTEVELKQALNNSLTKFIEIYYQQPKELKTVLISYENTPLSEYAEVTQSMIKIDEDLQLLTKLFKECKRDTKGRVYNYSLFAFLYYAYGVYVSFEHLYNSELLRLLGVYKRAREFKPNHKNILREHKKACELSQYNSNIYIDRLINFIENRNPKHEGKYVLSYLVDLSHELTASKEYINRLKAKSNYNNVTYKNLPQPIQTLLLPIKELQIA